MSDKSLFEKHWRLISADSKSWTEEEKAESDTLQALRLPPLQDRRRWYTKVEVLSFAKAHKGLQFGLSMALAMSLILIVRLNTQEGSRRTQPDSLTAKGSLQVSAFWSRDGRVSPLNEKANLQDGDKIGASIVSSEDAFAYWAISDSSLKVISDMADIESSRLDLKAGESQKFSSSFTLVSPNQGENLIIVVCPKTQQASKAKLIEPIFNREFISKIMSEEKMKSENCTFVGYRLRRLQ